MKGKITAFERRIEILFFLTKQRKSSIVELAKNYSVCQKTVYNDIMFLSRYAPIYTKSGINGGVFLIDDYRNSILTVNINCYISVRDTQCFGKISRT